jgi:hypothetical protein
MGRRRSYLDGLDPPAVRASLDRQEDRILSAADVSGHDGPVAIRVKPKQAHDLRLRQRTQDLQTFTSPFSRKRIRETVGPTFGDADRVVRKGPLTVTMRRIAGRFRFRRR